MMKGVNKLLTTFFLMCLLISFASAEFIVTTTPYETADFSVYSSSSISSCACASTVDYVVITNLNSYSQSFNLNSDNDLIVVPTSALTISARSSLSVPYQVNSPCDARSQSFNIYVQGVTKTKVITKELSILQCQNLKVSIVESNLVVPICEPFLSSFRIENTGTFSENYEIEANTFKQFTSSQSQLVTIPGGAYADIAFPYQFECDMTGDYELSYGVISQKSKVKATIEQNVSIANTYDYSVSISEISQTCLNDENTFEITIENKNNFTDFFNIVVDAPDYVKVQFPIFEDAPTSTIALNAYSQTKLIAIISPTHKDMVGVDNISVSVQSKYAKTVQLAKTNISVLQCYGLENVFSSSFEKISACGGESFTQNLELSHVGTANPIIDLVSSHELVTFENNLVEFNGRENKTIPVLFTIPVNMTSKETITISAIFRNETVDQTSFNLFVDTKENCYMVVPVTAEVSLFDNEEYFTLTVQNMGERTSNYTSMLISAPEYVTLLTSDFELESGRRTDLVFQIDRAILFQDANNFNNGSIIGLNGLVSIKLTPNSSYASYDSEFSLEFIDYPCYLKAWYISKTLNPCLLVFFLLSVLVIAFGIVGIIRTSRHDYFSSNNLLIFILLILFVVASVFVFMIFGVPESPYTDHTLESNSTTLIYLAEDESKTIDLKSFFFDPDDNLVRFGLASYDKSVLDFSEDDSYITLIPKDDWYGNTTINLFVEDAYNESAISPEIVVEVLPVEDYSLFELFTMFCEYINLIVLFLLFVVVYVAFSFHPRPYEQQLTLTETIKEEKVDENKLISKTPSPKKKSSKKKTVKKSSKKVASKAKNK